MFRNNSGRSSRRVTLKRRHTGDVGLVLGAGDAARLPGRVAVVRVDRRTVAGLVALRTVGVRLRFGRCRLRLDSAWNQPVARGATLVSEVRRRTAGCRHADRLTPRCLVSILATCIQAAV